MNKTLKEKYMQSIFRFRRVGLVLPQRTDLNMTELVLMSGIEGNSLFTDKNISLPEIQSKLHISKSAISQMMNSLEKKKYIERKIDPVDRRKIIVNLTELGAGALKDTKESANKNLEEIISRLGEEDAKELIRLLNKVTDISEDLKNERLTNEKKR